MHLAAPVVATALSLALLPALFPHPFTGSPGTGAATTLDDEREVRRSDEAEALAALVDAADRVGFSGAILLGLDGKVQVATGVGGGPSIHAESLFEIASITKPFTAAAVCSLVASGDLELDAPIADLLPNVPESCAAITVRHLLQHTSGIPGTNSAGGGDDLGAVVPVFLEGGPQHEPGSHFEYWNQGYALLAGVVETVSGKIYTEFVEEAVFDRARLKGARFTGDDAKKRESVAIGRSSFGGERSQRSALDHPYGAYDFRYKGMGGIVANVWDLWRFDRALHGGRVLDDDMKAVAFDGGEHGYGLGWYVRERDGGAVHAHSGRVRGFVSVMRRYPELDGALILLANDDAVDVIGVARYLENALFGVEVEAPPHQLREADQATLVGEYIGEGGTRIRIERVGAALHMTVDEPGDGPLRTGILGSEDEGVEAYQARTVFWEWGPTTWMRIQIPTTTGPNGALQVEVISLAEKPFARLRPGGIPSGG